MNSKVLLIALVGLVVLGLGAYMLADTTNDEESLTPIGDSTASTDTTNEHVDGDSSEVKGTDTQTTDSNTGATQPGGAGINAEISADAGITTGAIKEFTFTAANFSFAPASVTVQKGDRVRITLENSQGFHDLVVDGYNVATQKLQAGQKETIEFVADKTGSFEYYCSVGTHRQMGMKGTLIVQ